MGSCWLLLPLAYTYSLNKRHDTRRNPSANPGRQSIAKKSGRCQSENHSAKAFQRRILGQGPRSCGGKKKGKEITSGFALGYYPIILTQTTSSMATTTRRKSTAAKRKPSASKPRKAKVGGATTIKVTGVNGKKATFSKTSCHSSKGAAQKQAESVRRQGVRAMVREGAGGSHCVFKGPRMTAAGRKIYQRTHK